MSSNERNAVIIEGEPEVAPRHGENKGEPADPVPRLGRVGDPLVIVGVPKEFETLVSRFLKMEGGCGSRSARIFGMKSFSRFFGMVEGFSWQRNFARMCGKDFTLLPDLRTVDKYVSRYRGVQRGIDQVSAAMVPAGRAAQEPFRLLPWFPAWDNTQLGRYGQKAQAAIEAEEMAFDNQFHRLAKRERDDAFAFLFSAAARGEDTYLCWSLETIAESYTPRALARNLISPRVVAALEMRPPEAPGHPWAGDACATGLRFSAATPQAPLPAIPGASRVRLTLIPRDELSTADSSYAMTAERVFVSRARGAEAFFTDLFSIWTAGLNEVGLLETEAVMVLPNLTRAQVTAIFGTRRLALAGRRTLDVTLIIHHLWGVGFRPARRLGGLVTESDIMRLIDLHAYHRFRYEWGAGDEWYRLTEFESRHDGALNYPFCDWKTRAMAVVGLTAALEEGKPVPDWRRLEQISMLRGFSLGAIGDLATQHTVGHWRNLNYLREPEIVGPIHELMLRFWSQVCVTSIGLVPTGISVVGMPCVGSAQLRGSYTSTLASYPAGAEVAYGGVITDAPHPGRQAVLDRANSFGFRHRANDDLQVYRQPQFDVSTPLWLIMTRNNWSVGLSDWAGPLVSVGRHGFDAKLQRSGLDSVLLIRDEPDECYLRNFLTHVIHEGNTVATARLFPGGGFSGREVQMVRSYGLNKFRVELLWSSEAMRMAVNQIEITNSLRRLEVIEDYAVYESKIREVPECGAEAYF